MNALPSLTDLLAEWRRLTDGEGQAIMAEDWPVVADQQARKKALCEEIARTLGDLRTSKAAGKADPTYEERQSVLLASELTALERHHASLLEQKRTSLDAELRRLKQTSHNLQGVRRAYGTSAGACWQSYS